MDIITIREPSEIKKYLKEGADSVYEFKILGLLVNVKFKCNIFDTRNKRVHDNGQDGGMVIFKAHSIKGNNIIVDRLEADKIKANSIVSTYIFADKVKAQTIESMNIEARKVKAKIINSLVIEAGKIKADYIDICELRNCDKLKAKKVTLLSMNGGKIQAGEVSFNNKKEEECLPMTRRRFTKKIDGNEDKNINKVKLTKPKESVKSSKETKINKKQG